MQLPFQLEQNQSQENDNEGVGDEPEGIEDSNAVIVDVTESDEPADLPDLAIGIAFKGARVLFDQLLANVDKADDVNQAEVLDRMHQRLEITKAALANNHTAKLWIQFMDMIELLHTFIKAKRTGNWQLHL